MSESGFYVTLSSNACQEIFPQNTVSHFWNLLASPLELKEHTDGRSWEVGLVSLCLPGHRARLTLEKEDYTFTFWTPSQNPEGRAPKPEELQTDEVGHFYALNDFVKTMNMNFRNSKVLSGLSKNCKIDGYERLGVFRLRTPKNVFIKMTDKMMNVLGLDPRERNPQGFFGSAKKRCITWGHVDAWVGSKSLWVYSDCCEYRAVGGSRVPLLGTVCVSKWEATDLVNRQYDSPLYLPVRQHYIDSIEVSIKDNTGGDVSFFPGEALMTLHFRRR